MEKMKKKSLDGGIAGARGDSEPSFLQKIIPPAILSFITALIYYPSLNYPFQFDDVANISKRFAIRFDNPLNRWWWHSRWLCDWLNRVNYKIGRFDPFYYRMVNVGIHILAGVTLFFLVFRLCKFLKTKPFIYDNALFIATGTSALFLLHPVQSQTVSYVIQARAEGLASLFILATLCSFVHIFSVTKTASKVATLAGFVFFAVLSCGTKEIVVVLPFLLVLVDWMFIAQGKWENFKSRLGIYALVLVSFTLLYIHYVGWMPVKNILSFKTRVANNRGNVLTSHALRGITPYYFFISEFKVVLHYLFMFIWPFGISVEYDWKLVTSFFAWDSLLPALFLLLMIGVAFREMFKKRYTFFSFGLFWFLIALAPRSTIVPSPELVCDYKTYLPSVGVYFIFAVLFTFIAKKVIEGFDGNGLIKLLSSQKMFFEKTPAFGLLLLIAIPLSAATVMRNKVWRSPVEFWADNVKKAGGKARVHNNYGVALSEAGKIDESIVAYKKAIELDKYYQDPLSNLAVAYSMKGDIDNAIDSLKMAIHIAPNYPEAYNNLGSLLIQKKNYVDAERMLNNALKLRPYYGKAYYNLARLHEENRNSEKVYEYLKKATKGDLDIPEVFYKLGLICLRLKKYDEAEIAIQTTLRRGMNNTGVWFNLANAYYMNEKYDKARPIFKKLVMDHPVDVRYTFNLAETCFAQEKYEEALGYFQKATTLPRPLPQSFMRVATCLERLKKYDRAKQYLRELLTVKAPEQFTRMAQNELARIELQEKYTQGNGSIKLSDLKKAFAFKNTSTA